MIPRRMTLVTSPLPALDRNVEALVGQPLPTNPELRVVNIVDCRPIPTPFGGVDADEVNLLVLVDCEDGGRR